MSTDEPATRARESHALSMRWKEFECGNEGGVKNNTERLKFTLLQVIHLPSSGSLSLLGSFYHSSLSAPADTLRVNRAFRKGAPAPAEEK